MTSTTSPGPQIRTGNLLRTSVRAKPHRGRLRLRAAQRIRLRFAATLRHRLGEVGEQHREPKPQRNLQIEARVRRDAPEYRAADRSLVMTLPISTTNMTGFFIIVRGFSLASASTEARRTILCIPKGAFACVCHVLSVFLFSTRNFCRRASAGARESDRARARGRTSARRR